MKNKKVLVMSSLLVAIVLLGIGTIAYFRRTVNGDITGQTGNLVLIVNEANAVNNESFSVSLNRSEEEPYVMPDDKGTFDINIDSTGSSTDVDVTITISRTNLPDNLKFYLDENYTEELTTKTYMLKKSDNMTMTVPVYWFWDGSVDDENDTLFMGETLEANVSVSAMVHTPTFSETLIASAYNNLDTNVDFDSGSSSTNGIGLMMRDGTQNDEYPIVYYRGDVSNNNVIFADFCWLIVRTTETGGIKLVFNGPVVENEDGTLSCTNYSGVGGTAANTSFTDVFAGNKTTKFNTSYNSPVYLGYMYNDANKFYSSSTLDGAGYIAHLSDNSVIENGLDSETGRHTQNKTDSTIKGVVDDWYEANIKGRPEEVLLEDTIWCNDRSVISETYSIENYATNSYFNFAAGTRLKGNTTVTPSLVCSRDMDKFTVDSANGNGDLDYPIGLLTADEINLAGHPYNSPQTTYLTLTSSVSQWALSPSHFGNGFSRAFLVRTGYLDYTDVYTSIGARPSISLNESATVSGGNGSFDEPYRVEV